MAVSKRLRFEILTLRTSRSARTWSRTGSKYMCGIVWNQVQVVAGEVATKAALDGAYMTAEALNDARASVYLMGVEHGAEYAAREGVTT